MISRVLSGKLIPANFASNRITRKRPLQQKPVRQTINIPKSLTERGSHRNAFACGSETLAFVSDSKAEMPTLIASSTTVLRPISSLEKQQLERQQFKYLERCPLGFCIKLKSALQNLQNGHLMDLQT
ncbi:hypothetical protein CDAR_307121 [Caerostris darwini]|uniref:Uncharacterized protein n=1 Tax=Caerostris darwini TaxID=1538125 RepID=A0AAV4P063_9ARAC|nr:hypothetical protein CDAR_307121 [Caerostris darwini]